MPGSCGVALPVRAKPLHKKIKATQRGTCGPMNKRYLVVDTESSVCLRRRQRILVSLAYEVVDAHGRVYCSHYGVVRLPPWVILDEESVAVHGITPEMPRWVHRGTHRSSSQRDGVPLEDMLREFLECLRQNHPVAIVGHDVTGDVPRGSPPCDGPPAPPRLLINEMLACGVSLHPAPTALPGHPPRPRGSGVDAPHLHPHAGHPSVRHPPDPQSPALQMAQSRGELQHPRGPRTTGLPRAAPGPRCTGGRGTVPRRLPLSPPHLIDAVLAVFFFSFTGSTDCPGPRTAGPASAAVVCSFPRIPW